MKDCVYCNSAEIQERKVLENEFAFAFLTNIPIVVGHMLISPRRCVAYFEDLTSDEKIAIAELQEKLKKVCAKVFHAEGFNYAWNEGACAGQSIQHFHLHVLPRKKGDTGILEYEPRTFLYRTEGRAITPQEELKEVAELIRGGCSDVSDFFAHS